ncbi:MAG: DNA recombination protein RmuC [Bacteroidaceae bacterium]|nr:DNA recombination protein RmuC [Bacteroidaceae bacterium]
MHTAILAIALLIIGALSLWVVQLRTTLKHQHAAFHSLQTAFSQIQHEKDALTTEIKELESSRAALQAELDAEYNHTRRTMQERDRSFEQTLQAMESRLQTVSEELLKQRADDLGRSNSEQIGRIIAPLQSSMNDMRTTVERMREQTARGTAEVEKSVENLLRQATTIGQRADNLADAIRSNHKVQGNMGEVVLAELLQSQGLQQGIHFTLQATLRDAKGRALEHSETGSHMIPDVLLHFPDKKDVVIDSKVSLNAFLDYVEAEDEFTRGEALKRHIESVRNHVRELTRKHYQRFHYADHEMLPYVIMFVPQENALQLAMSQAPSLWREAFDKQVFIANGQTLIAALRLIEIAWRGQQQRENERKIVEQGEELLRRVGLFCTRFDDLGQRIKRLQESYDAADKTLRHGQRNMLGPAQRLVELGVPAPAKISFESPAEHGDVPSIES